MEIKMVDLKSNINKNYSNELCEKCANSVCKVYGGRCRRYLIREKIRTIFKIKRHR